MIDTIDKLIRIHVENLKRVTTYAIVSSELNIDFTDFQLGQIEGIKIQIKSSIEQIKELKEAMKDNRIKGDE